MVARGQCGEASRLLLPSWLVQDSNYQEWYDEEAHPLPELHTSRLKGVDAVLDEALGSPLGGEGLEGSGDEAPPPPGPQTLLAASVQLPWQATLAAALQLLRCCLGLAVSSANGRAGRNSSIRGGHGCGAASEVHASQPAGGESSRAQLVALSLFEALEPKQRGEAAVAAARLATPHCSSVAAAKAIRGGSFLARLHGRFLRMTCEPCPSAVARDPGLQQLSGLVWCGLATCQVHLKNVRTTL